MSEINSPAIRFAGFTDGWKERSIGECFTERNERSGFGDLISVTMNSGVIKTEHLGRHDTSSDDKSNYKNVEVGDIAYNSMRMWQGASGHSQYSGILSPAYTVITPQEGFHSPFFAYLFKRPSMIQQFQINSQGLTSDTWNLRWPTLRSIGVIVPAFKEQQRLSELFAVIDQLITLHQREHDKTVNIKKALLEKMFPKDGEDKPAIRFAGFTGAWEQREFAELVSRVSTMSDRKYDMPRVEYEDIISGQGLLNKNIYEKQSNKRGVHFEPGDILFGKLRPYLQNWLAPDFTGIAVGDWWVLKPQGVNTEFICALLQSPQYQRVSNLSTGTKMPRSDWSVVARTTFAVPSQICEQAQIGKTFTNLDRLITLHNRELTKLQNIKKALLEKMFV